MSWIERAKVGDKVVCVDDDWTHPNWKFVPNRPVKNNIYTIREIFSYAGIVMLRLNEMSNPSHEWFHGLYETGFDINRFRPAKDTTHQVEALKRLCNPTPEVVA